MRAARPMYWVVLCGAFAAMMVAGVFLLEGCTSRRPVIEAASRVGVYMLATACSEDLLLCTLLRVERFETFGACRGRIAEVAADADKYGVLGRPVVTGRCRSWSPPMGNIRGTM